MVDPGFDRHEWETEWQALEPLVEDSPAEALPELDGLIERMMIARGLPVSEDAVEEPPEPELLAALRQPHDVNRLCRVGRRLDRFILGAHRGRSVPASERYTFGTVP